MNQQEQIQQYRRLLRGIHRNILTDEGSLEQLKFKIGIIRTMIECVIDPAEVSEGQDEQS